MPAPESMPASSAQAPCGGARSFTAPAISSGLEDLVPPLLKLRVILGQVFLILDHESLLDRLIEADARGHVGRQPGIAGRRVVAHVLGEFLLWLRLQNSVQVRISSVLVLRSEE